VYSIKLKSNINVIDVIHQMSWTKQAQYGFAPSSKMSRGLRCH